MVSAVCGGQWCQARRAAVPEWTDDSRCQLCLGAVGTLAHRHACPATVPAGGWPGPGDSAHAAIASLDAARQELLATRGVAALRLVAPPPPEGDTFSWVRAPRHGLPDDARWYIDGSLFDGAWDFARRTGFGVVVVSSRGDLLAYGCGVPPAWVKDAAGAEAWALAQVLKVSGEVPDVITDCLNLVLVLAAGRARAIDAMAPLARIWEIIFGTLDEECRVRMARERLC